MANPSPAMIPAIEDCLVKRIHEKLLLALSLDLDPVDFLDQKGNPFTMQIAGTYSSYHAILDACIADETTENIAFIARHKYGTLVDDYVNHISSACATHHSTFCIAFHTGAGDDNMKVIIRTTASGSDGLLNALMGETDKVFQAIFVSHKDIRPKQ